MGAGQATEIWLSRLHQANSEKKVFPQRAFEKVLSERFQGVCFAAAALGFSTLSHYFGSALRKRLKGPLIQEAKLILKCLR